MTNQDDNHQDQPEETSRTRVRTRTRTRAAQPAADQPAADQPAARARLAAPTEDVPAPGDGKGAAGSRGRRRRGRRGQGGASKSAGAAGDGQAGEEGAGGATTTGDALETAIAKGGTRVAAKKGRGDGRPSTARRRPDRPRAGGVPDDVRRAILEGPPRTMLVTRATDRTQIAVLEDRTLVEHYVTRADERSYVGNIYMARVQNVLPGMEAAFLDIGKGRNGVLYAGEVLYDELDLDDGQPPRIEEALKAGQKVLVQVTKDPMGSKGARLTQHLSLAGRFLVLTPNSNVFGISRKLTDGERERLRRILKRLKPEEHGIIVRTAAENVSDEALEADLDRLLAKWERVREKADKAKALTCVYEEPQLVVRVIRDIFGPEFVKVAIDDQELTDQVREYLEEVAPDQADKLEVYEPAPVKKGERQLPLFEAYHVLEQLRKALDKKVWLPSGGYLFIEKTEAMTIVDVNTGKFTGSSNLEETVLKTNLEAADEIVRQLRLRDIGGIIVIDFIDMLLKTNQDQVIRRLKRELLRDRTKTRVSEVSRLGLVQMTRKNVSQGLVEAFSERCENCGGQGYLTTLDLD